MDIVVKNDKNSAVWCCPYDKSPLI